MRSLNTELLFMLICWLIWKYYPYQMKYKISLLLMPGSIQSWYWRHNFVLSFWHCWIKLFFLLPQKDQSMNPEFKIIIITIFLEIEKLQVWDVAVINIWAVILFYFIHVILSILQFTIYYYNETWSFLALLKL